MHRYLIAHRMMEAAFLLESSDEPITRIASRVGYETAAAFSKLFHRHHGLYQLPLIQTREGFPNRE
jgi:AraC-like DNA-binding protein